ncbi:uncharacterized protein LOC128884019 [Hylaeus volcanicus]|uniref:uncharacterized protein LOC128884019 n=1 Tax=Hylaeus volcanicus TaxID=313075 RepID=UPI0023B7B80F|nr:uncharacterized protein LOC128884019 [Hylaeus volcanicus]XP_053992959.1 uncharacterized protein LOC128884019 [Hylaeus volcanicus]
MTRKKTLFFFFIYYANSIMAIDIRELQQKTHLYKSQFKSHPLLLNQTHIGSNFTEHLPLSKGNVKFSPLYRFNAALNDPQTFLLRAQEALCSGKIRCSSAKSFLKAVGDPVIHGVDNMILSNITKQLQSSTLKIHDSVASAITPHVDTLEFQPFVTRLENAFTFLASQLGIDGSKGAAPPIISQASHLPNDLVKTVLRRSKDLSFYDSKTISQICYRIQLNIPICNPFIQRHSTENSKKFPAFYNVRGFSSNVTEKNTVESLFDGLYTLADISSEGSPVYVKQLSLNEQGIMRNSHQEGVTSLVMWQTQPLTGSIVKALGIHSISVAITPNLPILDFILLETKLPFALYQNSHPPSDCNAIFKTQFSVPFCKSFVSKWKIWSLKDFPCTLNVAEHKHICLSEPKNVTFTIKNSLGNR